jgi:hypothetical protein
MASRTTTSKASLQIREPSFADYEQIAALQSRNGLITRPRQDWVALWKGNPAYERAKGQWPIGWVLEKPNGEVVGSLSNIALDFQFRGREVRAAASCAWVVDARYRNCSMPLMSCFLKQKNIDLFICTTVSAGAEPIYAFKFSRVPAGSWNKLSFWITNYNGFSQNALTAKSVPLAKVISYPVSAGLFCWDRVRDAKLPLGGSTCEIELCSKFDGRFDCFWEQLKRENDNVLLAVRSQATLEWHFRYSLAQQKAWILAISKDSQLVAYMIFDIPHNLSGELKRVRLVDYQALKGYEAEFGGALRWMLRKCREEGVHVLENAGSWLPRPGLPGIPAGYRRTLSSWIYYYSATDANLCKALEDQGVWAPSSYDGDASL